jgi:hypothetical protein
VHASALVVLAFLVGADAAAQRDGRAGRRQRFWSTEADADFRAVARRPGGRGRSSRNGRRPGAMEHGAQWRSAMARGKTVS